MGRKGPLGCSTGWAPCVALFPLPFPGSCLRADPFTWGSDRVAADVHTGGHSTTLLHSSQAMFPFTQHLSQRQLGLIPAVQAKGRLSSLDGAGRALTTHPGSCPLGQILPSMPDCSPST